MAPRPRRLEARRLVDLAKVDRSHPDVASSVRPKCVTSIVTAQRGRCSASSINEGKLLLICGGARLFYHPAGWREDGAMSDNVYQFRGKAGDTEKITINLGYIDLGHIDL